MFDLSAVLSFLTLAFLAFGSYVLLLLKTGMEAAIKTSRLLKNPWWKRGFDDSLTLVASRDSLNARYR